jgi:hypothetical protein
MLHHFQITSYYIKYHLNFIQHLFIPKSLFLFIVPIIFITIVVFIDPIQMGHQNY